MRSLSIVTVVAGIVVLSGCTTTSHKKKDDLSAPICTPVTSKNTAVTKMGHEALMLAACFWCKLSEEEREHFTEETEKALRSAVSGDVVRIESPERSDVYLVLHIDNVQGAAGSKDSCVDYTEIAHFEGKEVKYPKKVCFDENAEAGA